MYQSYFGFLEAPFDNKLDQRFLFLGQDHGEVMSALLYFIQEKKGLAMVCGDVGTGKTMLLHGFLDKLPAGVQPIVIANPLVDYQELLTYIAKTLGVTSGEGTLLGLLDQVKMALEAAQDQGKNFILIVDEAHLLSDASLEHIRLLSNIETPAGKLLQILLVGQYELSHRLNQPELRQLRQRINVNRFLSPLSASETRQYVEHRLEIAGSRFDLCFAKECGPFIYKLTGGVPRRINHLCDTALLICLGEGARQVNRRILKKAQAALNTDRIFTARYSSSWRNSTSGKMGKILVPVLAGVALLVLGVMLGSNGFGIGQGRATPKLISKTAAPPLALEAPLKDKKADGVAMAPADPVKIAQSLATPPPPAQTAPAPGALRAANAPPALASLKAPAKESAAPPPQPQQEPATPEAAPVAAVRPRQVKIKENDTLSAIAAHWLPGQKDLGMVALLLANPQKLNQDSLIIGEKLNLPRVDPKKQIIQLKEGIFYAFWGQYGSYRDLEEALSGLSRKSVRYSIMNTKTSAGRIVKRVVIGAYETQADLAQALLRVKGESE